MKEYIIINRVPADYSGIEAKAVTEKWNKTTDRWKADGIFVSSFIFPSEGTIVSGQNRNSVNGNVLAGNLKIVSVIIINADDKESAVTLAKDCPILDQSGTVEVREIMPRT